MAEKRKVMVEMTLEELLSFELYLKNKNSPLKDCSIADLVFEISRRTPKESKHKGFKIDESTRCGISTESATIPLGDGEFTYLITMVEKRK